MDGHQMNIVALAWSRALGLSDAALTRLGTRTIREDAAADRVQFLRLGGASALIGPGWALERAELLDDDALGAPGGLLELTKDHAGRCTGSQILAYASDVGAEIGTQTDGADTATAGPLISHDLAHVLALQSLCPPDDVAEAELTAKRHWFTLVDDAGNPLSGAGYDEWQGIVARLGVLTAPEQRRQGHGATVGRLTTNDAIDEGMIAQWCCHTENTASRRLAARLGYEECGSITRATFRAH